MVSTSEVCLAPENRSAVGACCSVDNSHVSILEEQVLALYKHYISEVNAGMSAKMLRYRENERKE